MKTVLPQIAWNDVNLSNFLQEVHLCCKAITSLSVSLLYLIERVRRGFIHFFNLILLWILSDQWGKNESVFCVTALFILLAFSAVEGEDV